MYTERKVCLYNTLCKRLKCKKLWYKRWQLSIHVRCVSYKYVKSLFPRRFDSLAVAVYKIEGNSFTFDPDVCGVEMPEWRRRIHRCAQSGN